MDHNEDAPPFAIAEPNAPQHLFVDNMIPEKSLGSRENSSTSASYFAEKKLSAADSQMSSFSAAPGLVASVMTDGSSSVPSTYDSMVFEKESTQPYLDSSSTFLANSLPTVSSAGGASSFLPSSAMMGGNEKGRASGGMGSCFSQLLRDADDANCNLACSRMPVVPEDEAFSSRDDEYAISSGPLISSPCTKQEQESFNQRQSNRFRSAITNRSHNDRSDTLLSKSSQLQAPLLSSSPSEQVISGARSRVYSVLHDDLTFEVSTSLDGCTPEDVMKIVGNPELLKLWCDPIESLVVTSSSDNTRSSSGEIDSSTGREYDAEWIEATTTALEPPPSHVGFLYSAGQAVLDTLGFASYGRITMFVERRRCQVGLTVGPFSGGIYAAHTINITQDQGRVRIVDRVRLNHEEEESIFFCGVLNSCLSSCLLPTLGSYMEQVSTSVARLRLLVENGELSFGEEIIITP